jgi:hypothetical protein
MNAHIRTGFVLAALIGAAASAAAQTPGQMEYERQQREYWRAQEQQRQEQQRQQQLMQDNARRQQEESSRAMQGQGSQLGGSSGQMAGGGGRSGGGSTAAAQWDQARQAWLKRPPLAPAQNPLIGQWTRPMNRPNPNDPFAQLGALMKGGLCEVFFSGDAVFEFRSNTMVGIDKRTRRADVLDTVEYRGGGRQVAVIPKATLKLVVFDFETQDRIRWSGQNCVLTRVSAGTEATATGARR